MTESKFFNKRQLNALATLEVKTKDDKGIMRSYEDIMNEAETVLGTVENLNERNQLRSEIAGLYELREANLVSHVRAEGKGAKEKKLRGYPVLFNTPTQIYGEWKEKIAPEAFDEVDLSNLMLLFAHDKSKVLAKNGINLRAEVDETGLFIEAEMPNTSLGNDIYELVKRQIIDGMSFMFYADVIETDWENKIDTIKKFRSVPEVSIVTFPAYPQTLIQPSESEDGKRDVQEADEKEARQMQQRRKSLELLELELSM